MIPPSLTTMRYALSVIKSQVEDLRKQIAKCSECRLPHFEKYFKGFFASLSAIHKQITVEHHSASRGIRQKLFQVQADFYTKCISYLAARILQFSDALDHAFEGDRLKTIDPPVICIIFNKINREINQFSSLELNDRAREGLVSVQTSIHALTCAFRKRCITASLQMAKETEVSSFSLLLLSFSVLTPGVAHFKQSKETVVFQALLYESQIADIHGGICSVSHVSWAQMRLVTDEINAKIHQLQKINIRESVAILLRSQKKMNALRKELQEKSLACIHKSILRLSNLFNETQISQAMITHLTKELDAFALTSLTKDGAISLAKTKSMFDSAKSKFDQRLAQPQPN